MIPFENVFTEYNVFRGRRFFKREKLLFLSVLKKEMDSFGYPTKVVQDQTRMMGEKVLYQNLYAGDLNQAKTVFVTYYDTPARDFNKDPYQPFNLKRTSFLSVFLPTLLISIILLTGFYFLLYPMIKEAGMLSFSGAVAFVFFFLGFMLLTRYRSGLPRRENYVRNTSSILALRRFAELHQGEYKYAFAFVDAGTTNRNGEKMLASLLEDKKVKIINLDAVAASTDTHIFTNKRVKTKQSDVFLHPRKEAAIIGDILIASGIEKNNQVLVDTQVDQFNLAMIEERINQLVALLEEVS